MRNISKLETQEVIPENVGSEFLSFFQRSVYDSDQELHLPVKHENKVELSIGDPCGYRFYITPYSTQP